MTAITDMIAQFYWRAVYNKTEALQRKLDSEPVKDLFFLSLQSQT